MDWEAIGAVGEILGALAVVVTLGYLAVQIRQNTAVARSSARQAIAQMAVETGSRIANDPEYAALMLRDLKGEELSEVELFRTFARAYTTMRHWENIHYQYVTGMLTEDEWRGFRANLKALMQWKSNQRYWQNESHYFSQTFQDEMAAINREIEAVPTAVEHSWATNIEGIHKIHESAAQ